MQRDVFGRMAVADDHPPAAAADGDALAGVQPPVRHGKFRHQLAVEVAAREQRLAARFLQAVGAEQGNLRLGRVACRSVARRMHRQVLAARHPELGAGALAEPGRVAGVIRMVVGDKHAGHRPRADLVGKDPVP